MTDGKPIAVTTDRRGFAGGRVLASSGPWRSSGDWWLVEEKAGGTGRAGEAGRGGETDRAGRAGSGHDAHPRQMSWNLDEWDVSLSDGGVYLIVQDRDADRWFIDAIVD